MYARREGNWYDTAQVCLNGHTITDTLLTSPEDAETYCHECGEPTIMACQRCGEAIRGYKHYAHVAHLGFRYTPPRFCPGCAGVFPWTERKLAAANALTEELNLSDDEKATIQAALPDIVRDTPGAQTSAFKLRRLLAKASGVATGMLRDIAVDVASETAKKVLLGP